MHGHVLDPNSIVMTITEIHLPCRIAQAHCDARKGGLELRHGEEAYLARAEWPRES